MHVCRNLGYGKRTRPNACVFETSVHDLNESQRVLLGRAPAPTAVLVDGRTLQSTPESGPRAGYDGAQKRKGSKAHVAVATLGLLLGVDTRPEVAGRLAKVLRSGICGNEAKSITVTI
ncbi:transposase [Hymenobacter gelipurpurascens]|uniref:transposase n=1 Tax=Hymenobacter gelipurpurascens TaxID=89968 RepID=UPI0026C86809